MTTQQHEPCVRWWHVGLIALLLFLGAVLGQIPALKQSRWWYSEAGYKEVWTLWWVGLYAAGAWWSRRRGSLGLAWQILWGLTLIVAFSGFWNLIEYVKTSHTVGDLVYNHFLGAQRAYKGVAVYDVRGLSQSVNASPFVLALLRPFGGMSAKAFLPWWLGAQILFLLAFWTYGWIWLQWLWRGKEDRTTNSPGLPEFGILVITTLFFNSFQRSWRLGQLDVMILFLIAAGCFHACWVSLRQDSRSYHGWLGGFLLAMAIGVKIVPVLALGPAVLWFVSQKWRVLRDKTAKSQTPLALQRWRPIFLGGVLGLLVVISSSLLGVGWKESGRFFANLPKISKGSTAGVNYALVGRFAKYRDPKLRLRHFPLPPQDRRYLWPLRLLVVVGWVWLAWVVGQSQLPLLMMLGLLSLPLVSPMCWDIYYIWCANFAWFLVFVVLMGRRDSLWDPALDPPKPKAPARTKQWLALTLLGSSFYSMGLAGNSVIRSIHTMKLVDLKLPLWFDEARLAGYFLFVVLLVWVILAAHRAETRSAPTG